MVGLFRARQANQVLEVQVAELQDRVRRDAVRPRAGRHTRVGCTGRMKRLLLKGSKYTQGGLRASPWKGLPTLHSPSLQYGKR